MNVIPAFSLGSRISEPFLNQTTVSKGNSTLPEWPWARHLTYLSHESGPRPKPYDKAQEMSLWVQLISGTSSLPTWATLAFIQFFPPAMCPPASKHLRILFLLPGIVSSLLKPLPRWCLQITSQMSPFQGSSCWFLKLDHVHYFLISLALTFILPLQFTMT